MTSPTDVPPTLVVPCYNEGARLDDVGLLSLTEGEDAARLLFVDDGSRDNTGKRLRHLQAMRPVSIEVLTLDTNQGKGEAVRRGLVQAAAGHGDIVGYIDADLATPPAEVGRLIQIMKGNNANVLLASRVSLLGRTIERSALRHYLGRVFASGASFMLGLGVYDTQCGAKLFRNGPSLAAALREPFLSRWVFDVELIGRLITGSGDTLPIDVASLVEEPLQKWRDVPGSKLGAGRMAQAGLDILRISRDLSRRRRSRL